VLLDQQGMSVRAIARALRVGRNQIRKILAANAAARSGEMAPSALPPPPATRPSMFDEHEDFILALLA